ncbi:hypothetical protein D2L64_01860 [Micromonospora radicis]|uniref:Uncharacterized protein n=1 Tax=Micromonospora radicis TaxID=1894971 RepID=A0A418N0Y5_9ACTN|nr:hypothetical protein D2L64_01860 [Micromonospora radicis]
MLGYDLLYTLYPLFVRMIDIPRSVDVPIQVGVGVYYGLPAAGIVVTPVTIAFAWSTDYSTAPKVVAVEITMVLAALAGATVLTRRLALHLRPVRA